MPPSHAEPGRRSEAHPQDFRLSLPKTWGKSIDAKRLQVHAALRPLRARSSGGVVEPRNRLVTFAESLLGLGEGLDFIRVQFALFLFLQEGRKHLLVPILGFPAILNFLQQTLR